LITLIAAIKKTDRTLSRY